MIRQVTPEWLDTNSVLPSRLLLERYYIIAYKQGKRLPYILTQETEGRRYMFKNEVGEVLIPYVSINPIFVMREILHSGYQIHAIKRD